eukprot:3380893-Prymnesium_polylepis.1
MGLILRLCALRSASRLELPHTQFDMRFTCDAACDAVDDPRETVGPSRPVPSAMPPTLKGSCTEWHCIEAEWERVWGRSGAVQACDLARRTPSDRRPTHGLAR